MLRRAAVRVRDAESRLEVAARSRLHPAPLLHHSLCCEYRAIYLRVQKIVFDLEICGLRASVFVTPGMDPLSCVSPDGFVCSGLISWIYLMVLFAVAAGVCAVRHGARSGGQGVRDFAAHRAGQRQTHATGSPRGPEPQNIHTGMCHSKHTHQYVSLKTYTPVRVTQNIHTGTCHSKHTHWYVWTQASKPGMWDP